LRAVIGGNFGHADDGVGIFSVYVKNGNGLPLSQIGGEARGVELNGRRGEAEQIVHDDVNCAADGVGGKIAHIECFRPDSLTRKGGVAM
jgi:hypothetical protein